MKSLNRRPTLTPLPHPRNVTEQVLAINWGNLAAEAEASAERHTMKFWREMPQHCRPPGIEQSVGHGVESRSIRRPTKRPTLRPTWPVARFASHLNSLAKFTSATLSERATFS